MLPNEIKFSGLEPLDPFEILTPRKLSLSPYPINWTRHQFNKEHSENCSLAKLDDWLEKNLIGRWGSYCFGNSGKLTFVVVFEKINDALMFKLKDGENDFTR